MHVCIVVWQIGDRQRHHLTEPIIVHEFASAGAPTAEPPVQLGRSVTDPARAGRRRVLVVGATGSIGRQALDVIKRSPSLEVAGLAAHHNGTALLAASRQTGCRDIALLDHDALGRAGRDADDVRVHRDPVSLLEASPPDIVLNAASGAAGLDWTLHSISRGVDLALGQQGVPGDRRLR